MGTLLVQVGGGGVWIIFYAIQKVLCSHCGGHGGTSTLVQEHYCKTTLAKRNNEKTRDST